MPTLLEIPANSNEVYNRGLDEFSEHMPGCLSDGGCPNLDKASQNRAMRGHKTAWAYWSNTITGKSLE
jgi:hypothetical protein